MVPNACFVDIEEIESRTLRDKLRVDLFFEMRSGLLVAILVGGVVHSFRHGCETGKRENTFGVHFRHAPLKRVAIDNVPPAADPQTFVPSAPQRTSPSTIWEMIHSPAFRINGYDAERNSVSPVTAA